MAESKPEYVGSLQIRIILITSILKAVGKKLKG
jgi:hypothetical protein